MAIFTTFPSDVTTIEFPYSGGFALTPVVQTISVELEDVTKH